MIHFPVVRKLLIENYEVYKNDSNDGINHEFNGGVHLIVGINGLGKTTLLNAIFRSLVGPNDMPKSDDRPLGSVKHALVPWRKNRFFSSRVSDQATDAFVYMETSFGDRIVKVKRKLSNLEVVFLEIDGIQKDASQQQYEDSIVELSGLPDFIDFFAILKFLVFFLEDRSELIWDYRSQFEMFRILFYDRETSLKAVKHYDNAQAADSGYRNLHAALSKTRTQLQSIESPDVDQAKKELRVLETQLRAVEDNQLYLDKKIQDIYIQYEENKHFIAVLKRSVDEKKFGIEEIYHKIYMNYYKDIDDSKRMLVLNAAIRGDCFLCGSEEVSKELIRKSLEGDFCPFCQSPHSKQEKTEMTQESLDLLEERLDKLQKKASDELILIEKRQSLSTDLLSELDSLQEQMGLLSEDRRKLTDMVRRLEKNIPDDDLDAAELKRQLKIGDAELSAFDTIRKNETANYQSILLAQEQMLRDKMKRLCQKFEHYSRSLLAEKVLLKIDDDYRSIGQQGEKLPFPCFKVYMTSSVFKLEPHLRDSPEQVSESQREFIDLAFRLALIDLVSEDRNSPSMIVMETPEASLDSMFINEVSLLFRDYSEKNDGRNLFLASSNLNQSAMISSLLGVGPRLSRREFSNLDVQLDLVGKEISESYSSIPREKRPKHIINLLELSAPNMALRGNKELYTKMFNDAVYSDLLDQGG